MEIFQGATGGYSSLLSVHFLTDVNSELFVAYLILSLFIKRPIFLLAFFMSCLLFEIKFFDGLAEYNLYLLTFLIYTYIFQICRTSNQRLGCGIILFLSMALSIDAALYGEYGHYGASKTILYNNIEHLALYAHVIFICSLVPCRRIKNGIRHFVASILHLSRNSVVMQFI